MLNRRKFIQQSVFTAGSILATSSVIPVFGEEITHKLTILHTNDTHSRLDPFPMDGSNNAGLGGVAARAKLIEEIRRKEEHVLLLDSGDFFQGTPYFNFYKGEPELKAMSKMGYEATTIGNHEFDAGMENLAKQLARHASFPAVICNYDFTRTPMENKIVPWKIIKKGELKIGITGLGIEMKGLVSEALYGETKYLDPVQQLNETAYLLKRKKDCDMVICLSHLGDKYDNNKVNDEILAKETEYVDLILGGHTHRFFDAPRLYKNKKGDDVLVNQVGWAGIVLGRLDFIFLKNKKKNLDKNHSILIGKRPEE
jgi:5'-nucleotidase